MSGASSIFPTNFTLTYNLNHIFIARLISQIAYLIVTASLNKQKHISKKRMIN